MAQKLVHCDFACLNAEQFGTILHWGVMKSTPFHRFAPLRPSGAKRIMRNSHKKRTGNPADLSLGNNNILA